MYLQGDSNRTGEQSTVARLVARGGRDHFLNRHSTVDFDVFIYLNIL